VRIYFFVPAALTGRVGCGTVETLFDGTAVCGTPIAVLGVAIVARLREAHETIGTRVTIDPTDAARVTRFYLFAITAAAVALITVAVVTTFATFHDTVSTLFALDSRHAAVEAGFDFAVARAAVAILGVAIVAHFTVVELAIATSSDHGWTAGIWGVFGSCARRERRLRVLRRRREGDRGGIFRVRRIRPPPSAGYGGCPTATPKP
jgi:hypothetical protein